MLVLSNQLSTSGGGGGADIGGGGESSDTLGLLVSNISLWCCVTSYPLGSIKTTKSFSGTCRIWPLVAKTQLSVSDLSVFELISQWCGSQQQSRTVSLLAAAPRGLVGHGRLKRPFLVAAGRSFPVLDDSWLPLQSFISSSLSGCLAGALYLISGKSLLRKPKNREHCIFLLEKQGRYWRVNSWADLLKIATHVNMN